METSDSASDCSTSMELTAADVEIEILGKCVLPSPVASRIGGRSIHFVGAADKVLIDDAIPNQARDASKRERPGFEMAGPRDRIFFDPRTVRCGIVTCGGLAPGLNNVIRGLVLELWLGYGVRHVVGFRYGYEGVIADGGHMPIPLTPEVVAHIHHDGGTILGSSRGSQDAAKIVDSLQANAIDIFFVIGGDGTMSGVLKICEEIRARHLRIAVIGLPKTIDNDIGFIDRSFGFVSAYSAAVDVIRSVRVEATAARNGIGLVKVMGRHAGFLACQAALASTEVDLVLIPEVPTRLDGETGVFAYVESILARKGYAVIVVAEGAAQDLIDPSAGEAGTDKSGNARLKDVGTFIRDRCVDHFRRKAIETTVKYIDPSYAIRSVPACPSDSVYCWNIARNAVHAAMAGNTAMLIGRWHGRFVHVPIALAIRRARRVDPEDDLWTSVIEATGQPRGFA